MSIRTVKDSCNVANPYCSLCSASMGYAATYTGFKADVAEDLWKIEKAI